MEVGLRDGAERLRREVREFLVEHCTTEVIDRAEREGTIHDWGLHRVLAARRWLVPTWPLEDGGLGWDEVSAAVLTEELRRAGAPTDGLALSRIVANTILRAGTPEQQASLLPPFLAGGLLFAVGFTEAGSGSDVAAARTRAIRDGDEWVIDGEKTFTTMAHEAGHVLLLTRTSAAATKHRGLTLFLVPLDTPGVEVRPLRTLAERTNVSVYRSVRVPDRLRVGEVDGGWDVMGVALAFEHGGTGDMGERLLELAVGWATTTRDAQGRRPIHDPLVRERLAGAALRIEVGRLLGYRSAWLFAQGRLPTVEGSMAKLFGSHAYQQNASDLLGLLGADGVRSRDDGAPCGGWLEHGYRQSQVATIYGGTSEVQRSIIAEHGLGLPRTRRA